MSWGDTFGCDTFVYDPGKQSANDFRTHANGNPSLKNVNTVYLLAVRSPLKKMFNLITICLGMAWTLTLVLHKVLLLSTVT